MQHTSSHTPLGGGVVSGEISQGQESAFGALDAARRVVSDLAMPAFIAAKASPLFDTACGFADELKQGFFPGHEIDAAFESIASEHFAPAPQERGQSPLLSKRPGIK